MEPTLARLEVLVVDCQATAAAPAGHLLELGWARVGPSLAGAQAHLVALPPGAGIAPAVARVTGITESMAGAGAAADVVWRALLEDAARLGRQPAPTVVHYARFELPFLRTLAGGAPPLDVVCTHEIACRLFPDLPRRGLRALAGYFGRAVGELRRSADHVEATAFVWRELVGRLEADGISTWDALREWLAEPRVAPKQRRRVWPMPRDVRLALPDEPGIYRFLRTNGDVLYVGKAISLRRRVNSYFRHQTGVPERTLEMLSQARDLSYETTPSALEAALLETDEIKRHRTPYNASLAADDRELWFASPDFRHRDRRPSACCRLGPFTSAELLDQLAALANGDHAALAGDRWDAPSFADGYARFRAAHPELTDDSLAQPRAHLRLGTRLWREGRRQREVEDENAVFRTPDWSPEAVQSWLEWLVLRGAYARRRAVWLALLLESSLVWRESADAPTRLLVLHAGEIADARAVDDAAVPPVPPGCGRPFAARLDAFTVERLDRLRVLTSELKRLVASGSPATLRLGAGPPLAAPRLARALWWI